MPRKNRNAVGKPQGTIKHHPSVVVERKPASIRASIRVGDIISADVKAKLAEVYSK